MIFATRNQFEFKVTSRRDDLQSLCYLLVFIFQSGNVPFVAQNISSKKEVFNFVKKVKTQMKPIDLVGPPTQPSHMLLPFVEKVFSYNYYDKPEY